MEVSAWPVLLVRDKFSHFLQRSNLFSFAAMFTARYLNGPTTPTLWLYPVVNKNRFYYFLSYKFNTINVAYFSDFIFKFPSFRLCFKAPKCSLSSLFFCPTRRCVNITTAPFSRNWNRQNGKSKLAILPRSEVHRRDSRNLPRTKTSCTCR